MNDEFSDELILSDSQLREVIERAARLTQEGGTSIAELRQIADELDLDSTAVDQALSQVLAAHESGKHATWVRRTLAALLEVPSSTALRSRRNHALVVLAAAAAMMTPGDTVPLAGLLLLPMGLLYELFIRVWAAFERPGAAPPSTLAGRQGSQPAETDQPPALEPPSRSTRRTGTLIVAST